MFCHHCDDSLGQFIWTIRKNMWLMFSYSKCFNWRQISKFSSNFRFFWLFAILLGQIKSKLGSSHIRSVLIGVEYRNYHQTLDVYLLFALLLGQIKSKLGSSHIRSVLIGVKYRNCHRTLEVYLLFAILLEQFKSKSNYRLVKKKRFKKIAWISSHHLHL